jgi:hypothetical protein
MKSRSPRLTVEEHKELGAAIRHMHRLLAEHVICLRPKTGKISRTGFKIFQLLQDLRCWLDDEVSADYPAAAEGVYYGDGK